MPKRLARDKQRRRRQRPGQAPSACVRTHHQCAIAKSIAATNAATNAVADAEPYALPNASADCCADAALACANRCANDCADGCANSPSNATHACTNTSVPYGLVALTARPQVLRRAHEIPNTRSDPADAEPNGRAYTVTNAESNA